MISVRYTLYAALFSAASLTGCTETGASERMSLLETESSSETLLLASTRLAGNAITVAGPEGYCIDPTTMRSSQDSGFAALASCHIMSGGKKGPIVEPGLMTVTVSPATGPAPSPAELAEALGTTLLQHRELSALALGQMASEGETAFSGSDPKHWRGAFVLGPYLIGVTLYAPKNSPLLGAQGAAFVNTVSSTIRAKAKLDASARAEQSHMPVDPLALRLGRLFASRNL